MTQRVFFDCEFIEDGRTIDLVSIGMVKENGKELYLQSVEFNPFRASSWVCEHVFPHLKLCQHRQTHKTSDLLGNMLAHAEQGQCSTERPATGYSGLQGVKLGSARIVQPVQHCPWRTRAQMQREILSFLSEPDGEAIELWGYYSAYDHVALAQIFGTMADLPAQIPMLTFDLKQLAVLFGVADLPKQKEQEHHALSDAKWNREVYEYLYDRIGRAERAIFGA